MKKILVFIVSIAMVLSAVPVSAAQQTGQVSSYGKLNKKTGEFNYKNPRITVPKGAGDTSLPAKFDLRAEGRINPQAKDQGENSFCWAFATIASLESNLITKKITSKSVDLSEAHLAYYTLHGERNDNFSLYGGRDSCYSLSGTANYFNAAAGLARGYGAVAEKDFPYSAYSGKTPSSKYVNNKLMVKSTYELTDAVLVHAEDPTETSYDKAAVNTVKQLIKNKGAVCTRMNFPSGNKWLLKTFGAINVKKLKAYYEKEEDVAQGSGHAITIIGWDDTYNDFPPSMGLAIAGT
ncbi:MAG: C1 family peptidase, partial [Firmicutes bacterium]|nr:C1 family peptidase [Bacillota bacterium]